MMAKPALAAAVIVACLTGPVQAQFQGDDEPAPPGPWTGDWSGFYAGGALGGVWGSASTAILDAPPSRFDFDTESVGLSLLGGAMAQYENVVVGLEVDVNWADLEDSRLISGVPFTAGTDWSGSLRGRAGYAFDRVLLYGTGGLTLGRVELSRPGGSQRSTELGWTLGAGIETMLSDRFTARAEYLYTDYGSIRGTLGGSPFSTEFDSHTVRAGVTYRFR